MATFLEQLEQDLRRQQPAFRPTALGLLDRPPAQTEVTSYEPTFRQRGQQTIQGLLEDVGFNRGYSRNVAQSLVGGESSTLPMGIGVADFVPGLGYALGAEESLEGVEQAKQDFEQGNYGTAAFNYFLSSLGLLPAAVGMTAGSKGINSLGQRITDFKELDFDPRFDKRIKEQPRLKNLKTTVEETANLNVPTVSLADFEGYPFITSMADRTAGGGLLTSINDVQLKRPTRLQAGQDYMFENPGQVWASAQAAVTPIMENAQVLKQVTGKDPLYIPFRMAPTGGDFATMTGETMLAYAESALPKTTKKALDKQIKSIAPEWKGIDSPESITQFQKLPDKKRKAIKKALDVNFRDEGGLSIGEARLSVADTKQLTGQDAGIMNIGRIFADKPMIMQSGHVSYPRGVPGEGIGRSDRDLNIYQLLEKAATERKVPDPSNPRTTDIRALQMKPYTGILDENLLKSLGF